MTCTFACVTLVTYLTISSSICLHVYKYWSHCVSLCCLLIVFHHKINNVIIITNQLTLVFHSKPFHSHACYKCFSHVLWRCGYEFSASTVADCYCLLLRYTLRCTVVRAVFVRTTLVHSLYSIRLTAVWNIFRISEFMCRQSIFHAMQLLTCSTIATMAVVCVFIFNSPLTANCQLTVGAEPASSPTGAEHAF